MDKLLNTTKFFPTFCEKIKCTSLRHPLGIKHFIELIILFKFIEIFTIISGDYKETNNSIVIDQNHGKRPNFQNEW